jgi:hypothetical protein
MTTYFWLITFFAIGVVAGTASYVADLALGWQIYDSLTGALPSGSYTVITNAPVRAPEINAASGSHAIALIVGALLLAGERFRNRHS